EVGEGEGGGRVVECGGDSWARELAFDAHEALSGGFGERIRAYWATGEFDYLARAALAPYARLLRETGQSPERGLRGNCVFCGGGDPGSSGDMPPGPGSDMGARCITLP